MFAIDCPIHGSKVLVGTRRARRGDVLVTTLVALPGPTERLEP
jgi:hypothetical protein